jgi:hypothetical protein
MKANPSLTIFVEHGSYSFSSYPADLTTTDCQYHLNMHLFTMDACSMDTNIDTPSALFNISSTFTLLFLYGHHLTNYLSSWNILFFALETHFGSNSMVLLWALLLHLCLQGIKLARCTQ